MKDQFLFLGLELAAAVFICAFIGYQVDVRMDSNPIGMSMGVVIGAIVGIWNIIRLGLKIK